MNLEQLIKPSLFHKVLNRTPNVFQIVPANRSEGCLDGFHILVEEAMKAEATSSSLKNSEVGVLLAFCGVRGWGEGSGFLARTKYFGVV